MTRFGSKCFCCYLVALSLFIFAGAAHSDEKVVKLRYATFSPPMSTLAGLSDEWCKEVEKRTNGKVKFSFHPGGTLTPAPQAYEAVIRGITDISLTSTQWAPGRFPMAELINLPLGLKNAQVASKLINAWYEKFKPKEFDDTKVLYLFASGPSHFMTLKQLPSIYELKGMKIRAAGDSSKIVAAMDAVPVSVPISDAYEAFQRGICEGVFLSAETLKSFKWGDLLRGLQINNGIGSVNTLLVVMNKKKWEALPQDVKKVIEEVSQEWIEKTGKIWDEVIDKEAIEYAETKGLKVFKISGEEEAASVGKMKPILDDYVANMKKLDLPGEETLKFAIDFIKTHQQ